MKKNMEDLKSTNSNSNELKIYNLNSFKNKEELNRVNKSFIENLKQKKETPKNLKIKLIADILSGKEKKMKKNKIQPFLPKEKEIWNKINTKGNNQPNENTLYEENMEDLKSTNTNSNELKIYNLNSFKNKI